MGKERRGEGRGSQGSLGIAWVCGGSIRDETSAFGFRHNEFEDVVGFTMKCGCDCPVVFWEHRTRTWRRCQS